MLLLLFTGFGVSSWGAKPLFIENEVVSEIISLKDCGLKDSKFSFVVHTAHSVTA